MLWLLEYKCQSIIRAMYTPAFILQHPIAVAGVPEYNWFFSCLVIFYFFIRSSGFLFIRSSGFGLMYQFVDVCLRGTFYQITIETNMTACGPSDPSSNPAQGKLV